MLILLKAFSSSCSGKIGEKNVGKMIFEKKKIESLPCVEFLSYTFPTLPTQPWPPFLELPARGVDEWFERGHGSIKILSAGYKNIDLCIADGFDVVVHSLVFLLERHAKGFCCLFGTKVVYSLSLVVIEPFSFNRTSSDPQCEPKNLLESAESLFEKIENGFARLLEDCDKDKDENRRIK